VVAAPHVHPHQREDFRVESGAVDLRVGDRRERVEAGGERSVPPGTAHAWGQAGPDEAHVVVRLTSAFRATQCQICAQQPSVDHGAPKLQNDGSASVLPDFACHTA
jgi:uncharacterized cupin superfamily protein